MIEIQLVTDAREVKPLFVNRLSVFVTGWCLKKKKYQKEKSGVLNPLCCNYCLQKLPIFFDIVKYNFVKL